MSLKTKRDRLCMKCQACCKILAIPMKMPARSALAFYHARGCTFRTRKNGLHIVIPVVCPQLTKDGCGIYDSRPIDCKEFDGRSDPLVSSICLWDKKNQGVLKKGTPRVKGGLE